MKSPSVTLQPRQAIRAMLLVVVALATMQAPVDVRHPGDFDIASQIIGTTEIICALLIAAGAFIPIAATLGSAASICTIFATLSVMLGTPVMWDPEFPALSATGSFLIKSLLLLGACGFCGWQSARCRERAQQTKVDR